jgi:hypothetical protein
VPVHMLLRVHHHVDGRWAWPCGVGRLWFDLIDLFFLVARV